MSVNYLLGSLSTLTMLVCPGFPVLHAGEILLLPQAVHLALPGVKVAAVLWVLGTLQSQSHTIWNISWNIS